MNCVEICREVGLKLKFSWGVDRSLVGSTYTDEEFINRLYFENEYLFRHRPTYSVGGGIALPSDEEIWADAKYAFVRQFLKEGESANDSKKRHLIVANEYTSLGNQYANGFIHRRIKLYQEAGLNIDVMAFGKRLEKDVYVYDGVHVLSGFYDELLGLLASRAYESVSVHFMNPDMWAALKGNVPEHTPFLVYSHGYEVRNWTRMPYQITNRKSLDDHIERNLRSRDVWRDMYAPDSGITKFIFVSEWWKQAVSEDVMIPFDSSRTAVIHNVIDSEMFPYREKAPEQRFNLLWIRNASKWNYGADLAAEMLRRLKSTPHWKNIRATIVGDGEYFSYFDQFQDDENVSIHRGYLSHREISELHKEHGLFLVPSRWDTQGVSRDEAMSSGLVPVTTPVDAIPEFVDNSCAILGDEEHFDEWFDQIVSLLNSPEKFARMSIAAAQRVRQQSTPALTVQKEIHLMRGEDS